jgi:hypothetical protein
VVVRRGAKQAGRCPTCQRAHNAAHMARRPDLYDPAERRRRAEIVREYVLLNGWWCPGDGPDHPRHPSRDLTSHHVDAPGRGRQKVLCRSRNSAIGKP